MFLRSRAIHCADRNIDTKAADNAPTSTIRGMTTPKTSRFFSTYW